MLNVELLENLLLVQCPILIEYKKMMENNVELSKKCIIRTRIL